MVQDITQQKAAEAALLSQAELNEHQALHDALTGLANRTLFRDRIDQALRVRRRACNRAAVLVMDLDGFKEINDSLGHAAGDEVLVELGRRLTETLRGSDTVARLGGDEFGVLLPDARVPKMSSSRLSVSAPRSSARHGSGASALVGGVDRNRAVPR